MINVKQIADEINADCEARRYFWAIGTIKGTLVMWERQSNFDLLCDVGQNFANHYLSESSDGRDQDCRS